MLEAKRIAMQYESPFNPNFKLYQPLAVIEPAQSAIKFIVFHS